jgi:hypothetical protein
MLMLSFPGRCEPAESDIGAIISDHIASRSRSANDARIHIKAEIR